VGPPGLKIERVPGLVPDPSKKGKTDWNVVRLACVLLAGIFFAPGLVAEFAEYLE